MLLELPPLTTNYGSPQGLVTEEILQFYKERSGDVGLVIVEASAVRADGRIVPGSLGLWEDGQMAGMARLADSIRKLGAAAVVQINHAGARCFPRRGNAGCFTLGVCLSAGCCAVHHESAADRRDGC